MAGIKQQFVKVIERSGDPLAPIKLEGCVRACQGVGKMMAGQTDLDTVEAISARLLKDFTDETLKKLGGDPAFIVALAGCLREALAQYVRDTNDPLRDWSSTEEPK